MDYMILAATDVGLGTCYIGAFKKYGAHKFLELDETEEADYKFANGGVEL